MVKKAIRARVLKHLHEKDLRKYLLIFKSIDVDDSGTVTKEEIWQYAKEIHALESSRDRLPNAEDKDDKALDFSNGHGDGGAANGGTESETASNLTLELQLILKALEHLKIHPNSDLSFRDFCFVMQEIDSVPPDATKTETGQVLLNREHETTPNRRASDPFKAARQRNGRMSRMFRSLSSLGTKRRSAIPSQGGDEGKDSSLRHVGSSSRSVSPDSHQRRASTSFLSSRSTSATNDLDSPQGSSLPLSLDKSDGDSHSPSHLTFIISPTASDPGASTPIRVIVPTQQPDSFESFGQEYDEAEPESKNNHHACPLDSLPDAQHHHHRHHRHHRRNPLIVFAFCHRCRVAD